jgi:parallel beta-helix repeat protein
MGPIMGRRLVADLLLVSFLVLLVYSCPIANESQPRGINQLAYSVDAFHEPVLIASDDDFETQEWPGSGSPSDPYVIANLTFGESDLPYINISNVESVFVIENCTMLEPAEDAESYVGIALSFFSDCRVQNNDMSRMEHKLYLRNATSCIIEGNEFGESVGVSPFGVQKVLVINNVFQGACYPIDCALTDELVVNDNVISQPDSAHISLFSDVPPHFEFTHNNVSGNIQFSIGVGSLNISCNNFRQLSKPLLVGDFYHENTLPSPYIFANNSFESHGIEFHNPADLRLLESAVFQNNSVQGVEIPVISGWVNQIIDCSEYPQVVAYNCTDVSFANAEFAQVGTALSLFLCKDCEVPNLSAVNCSDAIHLYRCKATLIDDLHLESCSEGISASLCNDTRIVNSSFIEGGKAIELVHTFNVTIIGNRFESNGYGMVLQGTSNSYIVGNSFLQNNHHVYYRYYPGHPIDRWDDGQGNGNYWDDYIGLGLYVLNIEDYTIADHYPTPLLPWYSTPAGVILSGILAVSAITILLIMIGFILSRRKDGQLASALTSKNNWLLLVSLLVVLFTPQLYAWKILGWLEVRSWIASCSYVIWSESGWTYLQGRLPFFGHRQLAHSFDVFILMGFYIAMLLLSFGAWNAARVKADRRLIVKYLVGLVIATIFFAMLFPISPSGITYGYMQVVIPLPLAPLLIYPLLLAVEREKVSEEIDTHHMEGGKRYKCPNCGAYYIYKEDTLYEPGQIVCQNCSKEFRPQSAPD